ncbi:PGF-CTERM-anchored ABC transporter substrate-binding protein [Halorussus caseinilyticus]|uniref:PGF-CTERM-anchored ABC transporter substrate-binding protein n=1 Tax=Halorussus caseinilyticus TaxID=3034025 RepID=A0ABD5WKB6_9EURY|nr:PGF-CTERM-anchored ABC transporter substrate-binding protein [Halorussus sp. DT72]
MRQKATSLFAVLLLLAAGVAPVGAVVGTGVEASAVQSNCSFPVTATDATGTEVTVEQKPENVVTLGPSEAQTMWEIGGKSQVVGLTKYASYLDGSDSRTNVSGAGRSYVNVEKVVAEDPGIVLAANIVSNETVQKLRDAGLTVYKFEKAKSLEDIYAKTTLVGELTGNCEGASETLSWMKDRISTVRSAVEGSDAPRVFVSQGAGWTAGENTFINRMVELAGGNNVAVEANVSGYGKISEEVIVAQNPEWIVQLGAFGAYPKTDAYNGTDAVKNGRVMTVSNQNVSQPAPRVVYAIVKMAEAFHPDAFAAANATTTASETTTTQPTESTTESAPETTTEGAMEGDSTETTTDAEDSTGGTPGFGVPVALAALAGAAMLARRR